MTGEGEIRRARESYVSGLIELDEFERRVADVVFGRWSPTSLVASVVKEAWSDAPGGVAVYCPVGPGRYDWGDGAGAVHAISLERHRANLLFLQKKAAAIAELRSPE